MNHKKNDTHINVEVFNGCSGTCHGCMLSQSERSVSELKYSYEDFEFIVSKIVNYQDVTGHKYRPELGFGDFLSLPISIQSKYYNICKDNGLQFGITATLATDGMSDHYISSLKFIEEFDPSAIVNLTVDPFRALNNQGYFENIRYFIKETSLHKHIQILLSASIMGKFSPSDLNSFCKDKIQTGEVLLGFTPTTDNLQFRTYNYKITSAVEYAKEFYKLMKNDGSYILSKESDRFFNQNDSYIDFARDSFFIGENFGVFPMATTIYGDLFFDKRNKTDSVGNLKDSCLDSILNLSNKKMAKLNIINNIKMENSSFYCADCEYYSSCKFNGVGIARSHYRKSEQKTGGCYGPKSLA